MQQKTSKPHHFTAKERLRTEYFEALDLLTAEIERRFNQPGLSHMAMLERVITNDTVTEEDVRAVTEIYDDIEQDKLLREIRSLPDLFPAEGIEDSATDQTRPTMAAELAKYFSTQPATICRRCISRRLCLLCSYLSQRILLHFCKLHTYFIPIYAVLCCASSGIAHVWITPSTNVLLGVLYCHYSCLDVCLCHLA